MSIDYLIGGGQFEDERGAVRFINDFDMTQVVRFYEIVPKDEKIIRAWQGHKVEKKWFYCLTGSFTINIVEVDDFLSPSDDLRPIRIDLSQEIPKILSVPGGFATGIKASSANSRLQIFSNFDLEESKNDDYRFPMQKWSAQW